MNLSWFSTLNSQNNSLMNVISLGPKNMIICQQKDSRQFTHFRTCFDFYNYAKSIGFENNCFYEVIRGNLPQKPYFDIDISVQDEEEKNKKIGMSEALIKIIIRSIIFIYPMIKEDDIFIFNSHGPKKISYHIVVDNFCFPNFEQNRAFFEKVMTHIPEDWKNYCDNRVYNNNRQFRVLYSHKWESTRVKLIDEKLSKWKLKKSCSKDQYNLIAFINSLITNCEYCNVLHVEIIPKPEFHSLDLDEKQLNAVKKIFCSMKDTNCFKIEGYKDSVLALRRISPSFCQSCQRIHENENPFIFVSMTSDVFFNCRRGGTSIKIGNLNDHEISEKEKNIQIINKIRQKEVNSFFY